EWDNDAQQPSATDIRDAGPDRQQRIYVRPDQPQRNCGEVMTTSATESRTSAADQYQPKICLLKIQPDGNQGKEM
uniref:Uncharacterized protein n=1 Tax=Romanomermis culicivorax TaxID=13658 RepID=A0A915JAQ5_ROMCU